MNEWHFLRQLLFLLLQNTYCIVTLLQISSGIIEFYLEWNHCLNTVPLALGTVFFNKFNDFQLIFHWLLRLNEFIFLWNPINSLILNKFNIILLRQVSFIQNDNIQIDHSLRNSFALDEKFVLRRQRHIRLKLSSSQIHLSHV